MQRFPSLLAAALLTAGLPLLAATPASAIVGGDPVSNDKLSFVAQLSRAGTFEVPTCTGSLVDPYFVLTAMHCVEQLSAGEVTVRVGNVRPGTGGEFRRVGRIVRNPAYHGSFNDVALLELTRPVTTIEPVRLARPDESHLWQGGWPLDVGLAAGWGAVDGGAAPTELRSRAVAIKDVTMDSQHLTSKITTSVGPCFGDSGGPLVVFSGETLVQVGVLKSTDCTTYGEYSEVGTGASRDWILAHLIRRCTPFGVADWDADGFQDVIARSDPTGELWLYPGSGKPGDITGQATRLGKGWNGFLPFGIADWDGDGHQDIIARHEATEELWLYPGQSVRGEVPLRPVSMGGFSGLFTPFGVGDWNRDGFMDIVVRNETFHTLTALLGVGIRGPLGYGQSPLDGDWSLHTPYGVADWDGDGNLDILARDERTQVVMPTELVLARGFGPRPPSLQAPKRIGRGWQTRHPFGVADWDRDGRQDLITRDEETTDLWLRLGQGVPDEVELTRVFLGTGW
jgi:hypothetical protein